MVLQQIFQTQESNRGLLHCRQILYQLSYQGSPIYTLDLPLKENESEVAQSCRGAGTLIPSAQRFVWAARQPLGNAALGALFA